MGWTWAWHGHGMGSCTWVWSGGWPTLDLFGRSLHQVPSYAAGGGSYHMCFNPLGSLLWTHTTQLFGGQICNVVSCFLRFTIPKALTSSCLHLVSLCADFQVPHMGPKHTAARLGQFEKARDIYEEAMATVSTVPWFHFGWLLIPICTWGPQMTAEVCYNSTNYG